ncbi:AMP-binding protein [Microbispora sp. NBRC 16548]|uniref:AMP-binding protein n=1 Tax=Microbispora sp. NBRC 16548 TaxID=3030994 RepID=UPI0024A3FB1D|nr:AMP-binding protein [Microbispora sp. NBRC 16548]GLX06602.1 AMP-dependent synthetase [Microbispora sp. NBRC 16548]
MPYTVPDLLLESAARCPDAPAVIDGDAVISYHCLAELAHLYAGALTEPLAPGERVALLLPRSIPTLATYFGAHLAGLVPVIVHERLRPRQIARILTHAQAGLVVTTARLRHLLRDCPLPDEQILQADDLTGKPLAHPVRTIGADLAALAYTSGSTGGAKAVMLSHRNLVFGALVVADYLHLDAADRTLALLPWSFDYGLNQVLATFVAGGTVVIQRSAFPPDICRTLTAAGVTGIAGVPTLWSDLAGPRSPFLRQHYPQLRYLTNSGGALPPLITQALRSAHPQVAMYAMYGLTEAFRSTYLDPVRIDAKPASVGQAIPDSEILILDEHDAPCPVGVVGEIVHRGPTVALGYWRDPQASAAVFRPHPHLPAPRQETVVYSGDLGYYDADGDLHITGRRDEMVKIRGHRVTPAEIEAEIMACRMVGTVVAVISPATDGNDPRVLVAIQPHGPDFSLQTVKEFCRTELPAHLRPETITVFEEMPRTPHGKVDRQQLHHQLAPSAHTGPWR